MWRKAPLETGTFSAFQGLLFMGVCLGNRWYNLAEMRAFMWSSRSGNYSCIQFLYVLILFVKEANWNLPLRTPVTLRF